ncbi:enoyl-CoA hydratase [Sphingopyxis lindanitolerans]|uniref:Enoyl-CoA hydratase n=2 Tax=Sphingopyxis lindanitolerans TaxID=2054227 RepID=A0A2S8B3L4_9SPHN|nr:enoyl-CoA hydratase/isomerase family protein [Sphingopyxis lindanitolerans]PQM26994.1 enoyl-CoA hydratase [Sphingopyxis lindanitolerans]
MHDHPIRVTTERYGHVAAVTFANATNNHINLPLLRALADVLDRLDADSNCRATILRSEGKIFCAGADLTIPNALGEEEGESFGASTIKFYRQAVRLFAIRKPMIAVVQGAAIGAGLGLALAADFRIAAPEARFAANFVKLGFHPGFAISHTLPRAIGEQRAAMMMLTGKRLSGEDACAWGLADEIASLDDLLDAALALAGEIAENGPLGVEATRATLRRKLVEDVRAATALEAVRQAELDGTDDFAEGRRAVHERRPGRFERR